MENDYIMWLNAMQNLSCDKKYDLIEYFGSATDLYNSSTDDIIASGIVAKRGAKYISDFKSKFNIEKEISKLEKSPINFITYNDESFPKQLTKMQNPPLGLYIWGEMPKSVYPFVSIVGTRKASEYGCLVTRKLATELSECGVTIVSGMAYGVDGEAHKSCIEAGGKTIAVLGCGVDVCYPSGNRSLRDLIVRNGCVISEYPLGMSPSKFSFPNRNRIIACISSVVVVVEGGDKSGALITAGHALDNGRSVMAVPGNITSALSVAPNRLIADGCQPVLDTQDILDALNIKVTEKNIKKIKKMPDISKEE
ncbi:MAG: DNA-processing protein DprA, partial [Lachnospirales bacterium]